MACITSPALTDEQLLAFIDGAAADDVAAHLQRCVDCRSRANQLARRQKQLAIQLYRLACPLPLELGEYQLNLLASERMLTVEKHLTECLHCAREVQTLQGYLLDLAPTLEPAPLPAPMVKRWAIVRVLVAKLVDTMSGLGVGGGSEPTFAALRGEYEPQYVYEVDDVQIIIELQTEPTQPDRKVMLGLILGLMSGQPVEAHLRQADQALMTTPVDDLGNFVFDKLAPGTYTLLLRSAENEIRIENLSV